MLVHHLRGLRVLRVLAEGERSGIGLGKHLNRRLRRNKMISKSNRLKIRSCKRKEENNDKRLLKLCCKITPSNGFDHGVKNTISKYGCRNMIRISVYCQN